MFFEHASVQPEGVMFANADLQSTELMCTGNFMVSICELYFLKINIVVSKFILHLIFFRCVLFTSFYLILAT